MFRSGLSWINNAKTIFLCVGMAVPEQNKPVLALLIHDIYHVKYIVDKTKLLHSYSNILNRQKRGLSRIFKTTLCTKGIRDFFNLI